MLKRKSRQRLKTPPLRLLQLLAHLLHRSLSSRSCLNPLLVFLLVKKKQKKKSLSLAITASQAAIVTSVAVKTIVAAKTIVVTNAHLTAMLIVTQNALTNALLVTKRQTIAILAISQAKAVIAMSLVKSLSRVILVAAMLSATTTASVMANVKTRSLKHKQLLLLMAIKRKHLVDLVIMANVVVTAQSVIAMQLKRLQQMQ